MTRDGAAALLRDAPRARIGIVGDFALDAYWVLDPAKSTVSLETGLPTRPIREQRYDPGGGANIAANLAALGCGRLDLFGVLGDDPWGRELARVLAGSGADVSGLIVQRERWATPVFVKPLLDGVEQSRFDTADFNELADGTARDLMVRLETVLPTLDLVIVNEQVADSLHTASFRRALAALVARHPGRFMVDSRYHADGYPGAMLRMNDREAVRLPGGGPRPGRPSRESVVAAAEALFAKSGQCIFVSRGPDGVVVRDASGLREVPALRVADPIDIVGAGDSLLAGLSLALALRRDPVTAAELGILAASVTIAKLHRCGTASPPEILSLLP